MSTGTVSSIFLISHHSLTWGTGVYGGGSGNRGAGFGGLGGAVSPVPPGRIFILRNTPCNGQVAIEVDLTKAINDPRSRPLIQAGDTLILQYKCEEELINFGLGTFFTYGIRELLRDSSPHRRQQTRNAASMAATRPTPNCSTGLRRICRPMVGVSSTCIA